MAKVIILATMIVSLFITGCARGNDGDVYFRVTFDSTYLNHYTDTNPSIRAIPSNFKLDTYYPTEQGTFDYEYRHSYSGWVKGQYTLKATKGEKRMFFTKGDKGLTKFYTLTCKTNSASLHYYYGGY